MSRISWRAKILSEPEGRGGPIADDDPRPGMLEKNC